MGLCAYGHPKTLPLSCITFMGIEFHRVGDYFHWLYPWGKTLLGIGVGLEHKLTQCRSDMWNIIVCTCDGWACFIGAHMHFLWKVLDPKRGSFLFDV